VVGDGYRHAMAATPPPSPAARIEAFRTAIGARTRVPEVLTYGTEPDVESCWGPWPVTNANLVVQARITPTDAARRVAEINAAYVERGNPFAWVLTPETTSPELEAALAAAGLERSTSPEMYAALLAPFPVELPAGVEIEPGDDLHQVAEAIGDGFGFGAVDGLTDGFSDYLAGVDPTIQRALLARDQRSGEVLGVGTLWHLESMVQLSNIATIDPARGLGIGTAVTAALLNLGIDLGADAAMLTASDLGYPVYRKLGFETAFELVSYTWTPPSGD
jgi:ribosomal protein S18 acetylase RimI-like enzyme